MEIDYEAIAGYERMTDCINAILEKYPQTENGYIGTSILGRGLLYLRLGHGKSASLFVGAHHGMEHITSNLLIKFIEDALACNAPDPDDPLDVLAKVGGFDIAGMCGLFLGGALAGIPVVIDGLISSVSALLAKRLCPACADYMIASPLSAEPAAASVMAELGLIPLLDIGMALGEGTGAVSVMPLINMALRVYFDMPTFGETGIEEYKPL